jgi:hypothetical protein
MRFAAIPAAVVLALSASAALAQTPVPSAAVKAAHDATVKAKDVTYDLMLNGARIGRVHLAAIGRTQSRVRVELTNPGANPLSLALIPGTDCNQNVYAAKANAIPLNPVNNSTQISETVVNLPLTNLQGNYLVQTHDATQRQQIAQACARLAR